MTGTSQRPNPKASPDGEWSKAGACAAVLCWTVLLLAISSSGKQPPTPEPAYSAATAEALAPADSIPSSENALAAAAAQPSPLAPSPGSEIPPSDVVRTSGNLSASAMPAADAREPSPAAIPLLPDDNADQMPPLDAPDAGELQSAAKASPRAISPDAERDAACLL